MKTRCVGLACSGLCTGEDGGWQVSGTHYLWVARLDDGAKLKVTDPKEQQGDVEEEETKGKKRQDCIERGAGC